MKYFIQRLDCVLHRNVGRHLMPNEWQGGGDTILDTGRTECSPRLIWSMGGPICRLTMWIWILLWARVSLSFCIVSCQWLILSDSCSGLEKTEQWSPAGWQGPQSGPYTARPREAESWSAGQRRQTLHNQQHHPECQIYAYDVSYRAWWIQFICSYMKEFIGYRWCKV